MMRRRSSTWILIAELSTSSLLNPGRARSDNGKAKVPGTIFKLQPEKAGGSKTVQTWTTVKSASRTPLMRWIRRLTKWMLEKSIR